MSAEAARAPLTNAGTRIHITRRTGCWDERPATVADAPDFWSFAAGAANVAFVNRFLPKFIRHGGSYQLLADARRRIRRRRNLI